MLSDRQRLSMLLDAEALLKQTTRGYTPTGTYWRRAMPLLWTVRMDMRNTHDGLLLAEAHGLLKNTQKGYDPYAWRWREAFERIDYVEAGLAAPPVPYLGPVVRGDKPLLLQVLTHETAGLYGNPNSPDPKSHYPALDLGWHAGVDMIAPEPMTVTQQSSAQGADAYYADGESGIRYWVGHIVRALANGVRIARGAVLGKIAIIPGVDHGHLGVNARHLLNGRDLLWGKYGNGPDYTYGSPTIGRQLERGMAT